ncbi:TPA: protein kinase, partial [Candidatus Woesearchaeota archaeon]|nr:protein kinase [Candidatus Woesearchaeota archaeon]
NLNQPGLVTDTEVLVNGPYVINVRPWIEGKTLDEIVSGQQFTASETREFSTNIAKQLGGAHSKNIIHRDIKPNNVIRSKTGYHLIDFGVAKKIERAEDPDDGENATNMTIVGTPAYRAPEIMFGRADARADIYSLGYTLLYTLTGKHPVKTGTEEQKYDYAIKAIGKLNIDEALKETLRTMINPNKEQRYKTMDDVIAALEEKTREDTAPATASTTTTTIASDKNATSAAGQTPQAYDPLQLVREKGHAGLAHRIELLKKEFKERYTTQGPISDEMDNALTKDLHVTLTELGYELQPFSNSTATYNGIRKRKDGSGIDVIKIKIAPNARTVINEKHVEYRFVKNEYALAKLEERLLDESILDDNRERNIRFTQDGNRAYEGVKGAAFGVMTSSLAGVGVAISVTGSAIIASAAVPFIVGGVIATTAVYTSGMALAKAYPEIPYAIALKFRQWRDKKYRHSTEVGALEAALTIDDSTEKIRRVLVKRGLDYHYEEDKKIGSYIAREKKADEAMRRFRASLATVELSDLAKKELEQSLREQELYDRAQGLKIDPRRILDNGYSRDEIETIKELRMTPEEHERFLAYADEHYVKQYPGMRMQRDTKRVGGDIGMAMYGIRQEPSGQYTLDARGVPKMVTASVNSYISAKAAALETITPPSEHSFKDIE